MLPKLLPPSDLSTLPLASSPSLKLVHPTLAERQQTWMLNGTEWRAVLPLSAYLRREVHLARQSICQDERLTFWILVDSVETSIPRTVLASCESLRRPALVARQGQGVEMCASHGVGAVFCRPEYRGRGYAGRMMEELGRILRTWQQAEEGSAKFSVLYSDIGKSFYARRGWLPFQSSHLSLRQASEKCAVALPGTRPLFSDDISVLSSIDEILLRKSMSNFSPSAPDFQVAILPSAGTMQWHHAREEFIGHEIMGKVPRVKGALHESCSRQRTWVVWTRTFGDVPKNNVLHILRLVVESEQDSDDCEQDRKEKHESTVEQVSRKDLIVAVAALLQRAREEAREWNMPNIQIWNPDRLVQDAAKLLLSDTSVIHRDEGSIASLMWHGEKGEVDWVMNEKYAWL